MFIKKIANLSEIDKMMYYDMKFYLNKQCSNKTNTDAVFILTSLTIKRNKYF